MHEEGNHTFGTPSYKQADHDSSRKLCDDFLMESGYIEERTPANVERRNWGHGFFASLRKLFGKKTQ